MAIERSFTPIITQESERLILHQEHIPSELLPYAQWVCWRYIDRGNGRKPDKQPVNPRTLGNAGVHWANTWTTFDEAYATYQRYQNQGVQGIGFVLTPNDPFVAVDLDACVDEGKIARRAAEIVTRLSSYTEISPSGHGIRILLACPAFHRNVRREAIEVYSQSRYVTITGQHVAGTPPIIAVVSSDLLNSLLPLAPKKVVKPHVQVVKRDNQLITDDELWQRIFAHDQYGAQHLRRFQGDLSLDGGDHSFTVIRLLNCLARWTNGDALRMRNLMLLSPLANAKWFEQRGQGDWLDHQIADAIRYTSGKK